MIRIFALLVAFLISAQAFAQLSERTVEYKQGDTVLEGYVAELVKTGMRRPAVIIVHEWDGLGDYVKNRAKMIAELGYVAFAADIYGKGVRAKNMEEAGKLAGIYKTDRKLMRERITAALEAVKKMKEVDPSKIVVMGYCFGGTVALELARTGASVVGTAAFHAGLDTPDRNDAKKIKGKVIAFHGGDDPFVPAADVALFQEEMRKANVDWEFVTYGNSVHGFTNQKNGHKPGAPVAYNAEADRRSWSDLQRFLAEVFK